MTTFMHPHPVLFLVSAPSGAGKTTLCTRLLETCSDLVYSVSSTTRPPREGEVHGQDYDFLSPEAFRQLVDAGEFLEHATVHGNFYGTRLKAVQDPLSKGQSVLLDVDVQGAELIRNRLHADHEFADLRDCFADVFIAPTSIEALRSRLEGRGTDSEEVIERRMQNAVKEMESAGTYQYHVINDHLDQASASLSAIFEASRLRNPSAY